MKQASILLLAFAFGNPLDECTGKIRGDEPPPASTTPAATAAPPPTITTTPTKPGATATGNKPAPKPTPGPTPGPTPSPSPSPTPAPPSGQLGFYGETGTDGGLYPHASEWIAIARANGASLRKCYANANALGEPWNTRVRVMATKKGAVSFQFLVRKDNTTMTDATAKSIEDCHRATMPTWPWPSTNDIEGLDGGPAYLNFYSGMRK